jgi:putative DNA primase/helicase
MSNPRPAKELVENAIGPLPTDSDDETVGRLAKLSVMEYERVRNNEATRLGCRAPVLDKLVQAARGEADPAHGRGVALHDPDPWAESVSTCGLLDRLAEAVRRHVVLHAMVADAIALWIAHTWVADRFDHSPRLGITSPTRRCGKSTLLDLLRATCRRTLKADNISASGIFRTVEALRPLTLLVDETDSFLKDNEELRGVLNSGFERSGSVIRVVEKQGQHEPVQFATYCPVALAAIGDLPSTIADRAVPVRMERKAPGDAVQKLRAGGNRAKLADLARMAARWAADNAGKLSGDPKLPDALNDREGDISVPLIAIAEVAGPDWCERGRKALLHVFGLRSEHDDNIETGAMLLADVKAAFTEMSALRMTSVDLCRKLGTLDDRPWPEWRAGKPITPSQLAVALRPFGVRPTTYRSGDKTHKGYTSDAFKEAWSRYIPAKNTHSSVGEGAENRNTRNTTVNSMCYGENLGVTAEEALRSKISEISSLEHHVSNVPAEDAGASELAHVDDEEMVI